MGKTKSWGQSTVIDLLGCNSLLLKDPKLLERFCIEICKQIKSRPFGKPIIQRFGENEIKGLSAVQLIETSSITIHLDEVNKRAFIDVFSCKKFDEKTATQFSKNFFQAKESISQTINRG